jgi:uracil phosphoribosyltransferase
MQESSYLEDIDPRLHIYPSTEADEQKRKLLSGSPIGAPLEVIGRSLLTAISIDTMIPVFVLRGGLALWETCKQVIGSGPVGIIVPARDRHESTPDIAYASLPLVPHAQYALLDVVVASGRTMSSCLSAVREHLPDARFHVVAPFVAAAGRNHLFAAHPEVRVHCIWHAEQVDGRGRMIGPGFDIGDNVLGWTGEYLCLCDGRQSHA